MRNIAENKQHIEAVLAQTTQESRTATESLYGVRYSELLRLTYFDCVRFTIVDPMHNLVLGNGKHVLVEVWLESMMLNANDWQKVQEKVDSSTVPLELGRISTIISKMFSGFTAEQWQNCVTVFCVYVAIAT